MATAIATPKAENENANTLPIKSENVVYGRFIKAEYNEKTQKTDYTPKVVRAYTEDDVKALEADGFKLQVSQTVTTHRAGSPEGFAQLVPDAEESVNIWNRGYAQKESNKLVALFGESKEDGTPEFQFTEEAYDERELLATATSRRNLSPLDKAVKAIRSSNLPDAVKESMVAHLMSEMQAIGQ